MTTKRKTATINLVLGHDIINWLESKTEGVLSVSAAARLELSRAMRDEPRGGMRVKETTAAENAYNAKTPAKTAKTRGQK
jgi:hypothetical protein